jgi:hypothetical protein
MAKLDLVRTLGAVFVTSGRTLSTSHELKRFGNFATKQFVIFASESDTEHDLSRKVVLNHVPEVQVPKTGPSAARLHPTVDLSRTLVVGASSLPIPILEKRVPVRCNFVRQSRPTTAVSHAIVAASVRSRVGPCPGRAADPHAAPTAERGGP